MKRVGRANVPKDQLWWYHPEMQLRIARAEAEFAEGRATTTKSVKEARVFLDGLKRLPTSR